MRPTGTHLRGRCNPAPLVSHRLCALLLAAGLQSSCSPWPGDDDKARPGCSDPKVVAQVLELANTHPDQAHLMPSQAVALDDVRETRAKDIPEIGSRTFQRLCIGVMTFRSGESIAIGWEIFTTDTVLGAAYGIDACFGPYDRARRDCGAYSRGIIPGEVEADSPRR